jgi:hypothetical protein
MVMRIITVVMRIVVALSQRGGWRWIASSTRRL